MSCVRCLNAYVAQRKMCAVVIPISHNVSRQMSVLSLFPCRAMSGLRCRNTYAARFRVCDVVNCFLVSVTTYLLPHPQVRVPGVPPLHGGRLPPPLPVSHQRLPSAGLPLPHRAVLQGPAPHLLRAVGGARATRGGGTRVQGGVPGECRTVFRTERGNDFRCNYDSGLYVKYE